MLKFHCRGVGGGYVPPWAEVVHRIQVADIHPPLVWRGARVTVLVDVHTEQEDIHAVELLEKDDTPEVPVCRCVEVGVYCVAVRITKYT